MYRPLSTKRIISPIQPVSNKVKGSIFNIAKDFSKIGTISEKLQSLYDDFSVKLKENDEYSKKEIKVLLATIYEESRKIISNEVDKLISEYHPEFKNLFTVLNSKINDATLAIDHAKTIQKGDKGDTPTIDYKYIISNALQLIPRPKDGEPGQDGRDGKNPNVNDVIEIIKKDKKLGVEHIDGLKLLIENLNRQISNVGTGWKMRGGGDVVRAGSNVTITVNSDGTKTIGASGTGGSGYQAPTSGVVDGSNAVFVWATAPNAIVVDGVIKRKLQSDGITTNWSGTTTTTLTVAPNFDVYGIA